MSGLNRAFSYSEGDDGSVVAGSRQRLSPEEGRLMDGSNEYSAMDMNRTPTLHQRPSQTDSDGPLETVPENRSVEHTRTHFTATPGMDNMGPSAVGGGISGIALGVANTHDRQSGVDAFRETAGPLYNIPAERDYHTTGAENPYVPAPPPDAEETVHAGSGTLRPRDSYGSHVALRTAGAVTGHSTPAATPSQHSFQDSPYQGVGAFSEGPYQRQSVYSTQNYPLTFNPDEIADDGDDGFVNVAPKGVSPSRDHSLHGTAGAAAVGGASAGGILSGLRGLFGGGKKDSSPSYGPVPGVGLEATEKGPRAGSIAGASRRKRAWIVGLTLAFIIVAAIVGGAVGGILGHRSSEAPASANGSDSSADGSSDSSDSSDGLLDKDSAEIKALMNNANLHKVFPGLDYTPWGVQYPLCLKYPPSQNNVTRDLAVLSQLTNTIRLYGTDCNQTELVLTAIDRLDLTDMKLWLGVWIDSNQTTSDRQVKQLFNIIDVANNTSIFQGAIIGNEALYRAGPDIATAQKTLISYMTDVKNHFKQNSIDLPVGTSDLGDNWNQELVDAADFVMSNIHPFFGGVQAAEAASWAWSFWQNHDAPLTVGTNKQQIISEVGWPSGGGNDCGDGDNCQTDTQGAVAGIDEMNQFMADWVCQALENGTEYFWFEAFDEPWKVQYNTKGQEWEDKWGLMDAARKLKPGLKIPDCGGKTAA
ncbi:putative cell wall glucanase [Aspergillus saccharolyticus JOP 1030-1]|uniref:glucan endo-1,3-beta-D-glucosidase n=1 Tax=Aspergillus saccharolyticus JOP 1030-1 TaxID=1450539 RepID=A0A318ZPK0_9EURO|nr:putative glucan endo-1,3-beta-glucosidase btgC [Aspergillus saccharolyticus JOP 1030-1]PYH48937.1 putative glucan endo-1,3-beta-glucosidase btgC [Aspergillus saccharolyticus JOP 1030-1]